MTKSPAILGWLFTGLFGFLAHAADGGTDVCTTVLNPSFFSGSATWHSSGRFEPLELDGIRMDAFEKGFFAAVQAGETRIVPTIVMLHGWEGKNGKNYVTKKTLMPSIDMFTFAEGAIFTAEDKWELSKRPDAMELLGVRYGALTEAMNACYKSGARHCVYLATSLGQLNEQNGGYVVVASAVVRGYGKAAAVYSATSKWNTTSSNFSDLELGGIKFNAIEKALAEGRAAGTQKMFVASVNQISSVVKNSKRYTEKEAVVLSLDGPGFIEGSVVEGRAEWSNGNKVDTLQQKGIAFRALMDAIHNCYQAGYLYCQFDGDLTVVARDELKNGNYKTIISVQVRGFHTSQPANTRINFD